MNYGSCLWPFLECAAPFGGGTIECTQKHGRNDVLRRIMFFATNSFMFSLEALIRFRSAVKQPTKKPPIIQYKILEL